MKFTFSADVEFQAENIDDAFEKLAKHFTAMANSEDSQLFEAGSIKIEPLMEKDNDT